MASTLASAVRFTRLGIQSGPIRCCVPTGDSGCEESVKSSNCRSRGNRCRTALRPAMLSTSIRRKILEGGRASIVTLMRRRHRQQGRSSDYARAGSSDAIPGREAWPSCYMRHIVVCPSHKLAGYMYLLCVLCRRAFEQVQLFAETKTAAGICVLYHSAPAPYHLSCSA